MKLLAVLCVFAFIALSVAKAQHSRGCYYINGRCDRPCEEGTHAYTTGCGALTPEPTCDEPHPIQGRGNVCDYSSCYCDEPTVRDKVSGKCVTLDNCPK